jgi:M6 family metalloprotease-like protein
MKPPNGLPTMLSRHIHIQLLCLLFAALSTWAILPPDPDAIENGHFESLNDYRRRLGIDFKYNTKHLNPEFCRTETEEDCQRMDEHFGKQVETNRKFLTPASRESLANERNLENTGTLNVLVCLMKWSDHANRELPPFSDYDLLFNADQADALDLSGSVNTWFKTSSYGQFDVKFTVIDSVVTDNTEAFYANPNRGRSEAIIPAFTPVLNALDNGGSFDFSPFDQNGDNVIDMVIFLHSGYDGVLAITDCQSGATFDQRIASHARTASGLDWESSTGYSLGSFVVAPQMRGACNTNINKIGIITHELIHLFGMPDLYDTDGPLNQAGTVGGLGGYDIMVSLGLLPISLSIICFLNNVLRMFVSRPVHMASPTQSHFLVT